jgi:hypothetical protein
MESDEDKYRDVSGLTSNSSGFVDFAKIVGAAIGLIIFFYFIGVKIFLFLISRA